MELDFKPYVRFAMYHTWHHDYVIDRVIFDHELIFIEKGMMNINIEGENYIVQEGDVVYLPPNVHHRITWHIENCNQPHFHFDFFKDSLSEVIPVSMKRREEMGEVELTYFREEFFKAHNINIPYVTHVKDPTTYQRLILGIISKFSSKDPCKDLALEGMVKQFIAQLISENLLYQEDELMGTLQTVERYMAQNLQNNLTLRDFELRSGVTSWTLNYIFKRAYNTTPKKYYDEMRARYATNLLKYSTKSIKQIASQLNFNEPQTFSRWYTNLTGKCPKAARRNKQN